MSSNVRLPFGLLFCRMTLATDPLDSSVATTVAVPHGFPKVTAANCVMEKQATTDHEDLPAVCSKPPELHAKPADESFNLSAKPVKTGDGCHSASNSSSGNGGGRPSGKSCRHPAFFFDAEFMLYKYKVCSSNLQQCTCYAS